MHADAASALQAESFDAVHCSLVLMFAKGADEKRAILRFFHDKLRRGGALILTELVVNADPAAERATFAMWRSLMRHRGAGEELVAAAEQQVHSAMHRCTPAQLQSLLEEAGFESIQQPFQALHTHVFAATKP